MVVDDLDECQDDGMGDLLKLIVRTGLDQPSKIKWLLTSQPLDSAERELLTGSDQVGVNLELNQKHLSEVVRTYIASKAVELDHRHHYGLALRQKVEAELAAKAEDTILWVSLDAKVSIICLKIRYWLQFKIPPRAWLLFIVGHLISSTKASQLL